MPNILDLLARAQSLMNETALNSITPSRADGIMYDTLLVLNQMQLEGGSLLISKIYTSVSAMEADTTPTSDLTGRALRAGQLAVIVPADTSSADLGKVYRFNSAGSWSLCGKIGGLPFDTEPADGSTNGITSGAVYDVKQALEGEVGQLALKVDDIDINFKPEEVISNNILAQSLIVSTGTDYIRRTNGTSIQTTGGFGYTDFIQIDERGLFCNCTRAIAGSYAAGILCYDSGKNFLGYVNSNSGSVSKDAFTGLAYVRFNFGDPANFASGGALEGQDYAVYRSTTALPYDTYKVGKKLKNGIIGTENISDNAVSFPKIGFKVSMPGKNLLDPSKVTADHYVDKHNGNIVSLVNNVATDYIPVSKKGLFCNKYKRTGLYVGAAVYDTSKNYIREAFNPYVYQDGDGYVRYSITSSDLSAAQVEVGSVATEFESYTERTVINPNYLPTAEDTTRDDEPEPFQIFLPDRIVAVVGDTLQIFYKGMAKAVNVLNYNVKVTCSKGRIYHRYWEYTPQISDIGTTDFNLIVRDDNGKPLLAQKCTLQTVASPISPASQTNVVCIGASTTANGTWPAEFYRRLTGTGGTPEGDGLQNITFCGPMTKDGAGYLGKSGWSWQDYATQGRPAFRFTIGTSANVGMGNVYTNNGHSYTVIEIGEDGTILCSTSSASNTPEASGTLTKTSGSGDASVAFSASAQDSQNPFWDYDNSKLDFTSFANTYCNGQIDVIYAQLGVNGMSAFQTDFSTMMGYVKDFADALHTDFPNAKLVLISYCFPSMELMMPGYGAGSGFADTFGVLSGIFEMQKAYQVFAKEDGYSSFVDYLCLANQTDSDYNFPISQKDVNTRNADVKEGYANNTIHAGTKGYLQFADAAYRNFVANFCQSE